LTLWRNGSQLATTIQLVGKHVTLQEATTGICLRVEEDPGKWGYDNSFQSQVFFATPANVGKCCRPPTFST
jgi:hypothetical protein